MDMENVEDILPLTSVQHGILFHSLEASEEALYFQQVILSLRGRVNRQALQLATADLLQLHPILRSVILWDGLERPMQLIHREITAKWQEINLENDSPDNQDQQIEAYLRADRKQGFDLTRGPLIRFAALYLDSDSCQLVFSFHHILLDGWSLLSLLGDLSELYHAHCEHRTPTLQSAPPYRTYLDWLEAQSSHQALQYWREQLGAVEAPTPLALPLLAAVAQHPPGEELNQEQKFILTEEQVTQMSAAAKRLKVTLNTLTMAAWALVTARYSSNGKALFGTSLAGRPYDVPQVEALVGMFIQTLPVVVPVPPKEALASWLSAIQNNQLLAAEHGHIGLSEIAKCSGIPPGGEMFESLLVFQNLDQEHRYQQGFGDLALESVEFLERSNYPLAILIVPEKSWEIIAKYDTRRFSAEQAQRLLASLATALLALTHAESSTTIESLDCLPRVERDQILAWGQGASHYDSRKSWLELFAETTEAYPEKIALCAGNTNWTYADLSAKANSLVQHYLSSGMHKGDLVGVVAQRKPQTFAAIIAVLLGGGVYVPLEPEQPAARLALIAEQAGLKWLLGELPGCELKLPRLDGALSNGDVAEKQVLPTITGEDPVYVIHTSGSTGTPRGVLVSHQNLLLSTTARANYYEHSLARFLLLSSLAFDSSMAGIFWTLGSGGTLVLAEPDRHDDIEHLLRVAKTQRVTHLLCIPSLYELLLECANGRLNSLRCAIVAGEVCPPRLPQLHQSTLPDTRLFNEYGPSEATIWASVAEITTYTTQQGAVPIGKPIPAVQLYIVDAMGRLCPTNVAGELCIAGPTVALGYLNDSIGTSASFVIDPFAPSPQRMYRTGDYARWGEDGQIYYIGREDGQLKIRGRRVDVGEIEAALLAHNAVRDAAVLVRESDTKTEVSLQKIEQALTALDNEQAQQLLTQVEDSERGKIHRERGANFEISLQLGDDCLAPPRDNQRRWLIRQLLQEMHDDVTQLSAHASRFVPGAATFLNETPDVSGVDLDANEIMEDWQIPVLQAMVDCVCASGGHVLEIGFGRGISADMIQRNGVAAHTIVEANENCVQRFYNPWREQYSARDIRMIKSEWQAADEQLGQFDGVFFHTAARNLEELIDTTVGQVTYAEHFFPTAARHLSPGGVFTYLANEIDSLSRSHQRLLLQHFSEFSVRRVDQLKIATDTRDVWWAQSMVVVAAVK